MNTQGTTKDKHCMGCKYYHNMYDGGYYCAYLFVTDKRRPCPPGKGCTVKEKRRKKNNEERKDG